MLAVRGRTDGVSLHRPVTADRVIFSAVTCTSFMSM